MSQCNVVDSRVSVEWGSTVILSLIGNYTTIIMHPCLPILHLLPVHPGSQIQVPGLSQTPFSQGGTQTAEERTKQMAKFHDEVTCVLKLTTAQSSMCARADTSLITYRVCSSLSFKVVSCKKLVIALYRKFRDIYIWWTRNVL